MAEQMDKAFPCLKKIGEGKRPGKGGNRFGKNVVGLSFKILRFWKSIGYGFKTSREGRKGTYNDKKCRFMRDACTQGRIIYGTCRRVKSARTIIVRWNVVNYLKKYQRYELMRKDIPVYTSPCSRVKEGDYVRIQCSRPLSKKLRFNVLEWE